MNLLIPTGSEGWFGLYAPSPVRSVFYQQWKVVVGLITILQVRKLRLWDIMRLSLGHILISTEPEGNPDFWHSALSTELIISLLSVRGALIHFYHQWVMTQRHCSSVRGLAMQSELLVIYLSLMGGLKHECQLGEGCGVQSQSQTPHPCRRFLHWEQGSPSCYGEQAVPSRAQQHQRVQDHAQLKLAEGNGSSGLYSFCGLTRAAWEERWWKSGIS